MANYPIKMLRDEQGAPFVPLVSSDSVQTMRGEKLTDWLNGKLSPEDIISGQHVTVDTLDGGSVKISVNLPEAINIINNLTTDSSGQGALDAYQGKVLYDSIPKLYDGLDSNDANLALTARQGQILSERVIPDGGNIGQVLKKSSDGYEWGDAADPNAIGGDGSIKKIIELSYAEYKELERAGLIQENIEYHIPEMGGAPGSGTGTGGLTETDVQYLIDKTFDENENMMVPIGGTAGQVLKKSSDADREVEWGDAADPNAISGDGSIKKIVEITYEEYEQLEATGQLDINTEYHINNWVEETKTYLTNDEVQSMIEDYSLAKNNGVVEGVLTMPENKYYTSDEYALDMRNSDIVNANSIYFSDTADAIGEGLHFKRSNDKWDTLRIVDGNLYMNINNAQDGSDQGTRVQVATRADIEGTVVFNGQGSANWLEQDKVYSFDVSPYKYLLVHFTSNGVNNPSDRYSGNAVNQVIHIDLTTPSEFPICNVDGVYYRYGGTETHLDMQFLFGNSADPGLFFSGVFVSEDKKRVYVGNAGYVVLGTTGPTVQWGSLYNGVSRIEGFK